MVYYPSHHRLPFLACYGVWVGQEVSTTELLLLKHKACRAFLTPEREKEKKKKKSRAKKQHNKNPNMTNKNK